MSRGHYYTFLTRNSGIHVWERRFVQDGSYSRNLLGILLVLFLGIPNFILVVTCNHVLSLVMVTWCFTIFWQNT